MGALAVMLVVAAFFMPRISSTYQADLPASTVVVVATSPSESEEVRQLVSSTPSQVSIIFGGDVMLSRVVGQKMAKYGNYSWPLEKIKSVLSEADLAIINLESPVTLDGKYFVPTGSFSFDADPLAIAGLKSVGIGLVTLANNHFVNQGRQGMADTFKVLDEAGISYVGAGKDLAAAHDYKELEIGGIKFCFLGYAYPEDGSVAGDARPGIANMDIGRMSEDVARARTDCGQVVVLMHAGVEYVNKPNEQQKSFARAAIDAGADLVVGHHPHWVQVTETYKGKPIIYSLGNLVFDQMWSTETRQGALAKVYFKDGILGQIEIIPIRIDDYGQANLADAATSQAVLKRMELSSSTISF